MAARFEGRGGREKGRDEGVDESSGVPVCFALHLSSSGWLEPGRESARESESIMP